MPWFVPWINRLGPIGPLLLALLTWFGLNVSIFGGHKSQSNAN